MSYEPQGYWSKTLETFDEAATAYPWLPVEFNRALYKRWRGSIRAALAGYRIAGADVLDIGAGSGALIPLWKELGAANITALDLAPAAVEGLRSSGIDARVADIGDPEVPLDRMFGVVAVASVLLHIPEEQRFRNALANVAGLLEPSGICICVDPFIRHTYRLGVGNSTARTESEWRGFAAEVGLAVVSWTPLSAILANPMDTRFAPAFSMLNVYWQTLERVAVRTPRVASAAVTALGSLDRLLCRAGWAPSAKNVLLGRIR